MPIYFCLLLSVLFMEVSLQEVTFNLAIQDKQGVLQAEDSWFTQGPHTLQDSAV